MEDVVVPVSWQGVKGVSGLTDLTVGMGREGGKAHGRLWKRLFLPADWLPNGEDGPGAECQGFRRHDRDERTFSKMGRNSVQASDG